MKENEQLESHFCGIYTSNHCGLVTQQIEKEDGIEIEFLFAGHVLVHLPEPSFDRRIEDELVS
jgi:hypothetical protein